MTCPILHIITMVTNTAILIKSPDLCITVEILSVSLQFFFYNLFSQNMGYPYMRVYLIIIDIRWPIFFGMGGKGAVAFLLKFNSPSQKFVEKLYILGGYKIFWGLLRLSLYVYYLSKINHSISDLYIRSLYYNNSKHLFRL